MPSAFLFQFTRQLTNIQYEDEVTTIMALEKYVYSAYLF